MTVPRKIYRSMFLDYVVRVFGLFGCVEMVAPLHHATESAFCTGCILADSRL